MPTVDTDPTIPDRPADPADIAVWRPSADPAATSRQDPPRSTGRRMASVAAIVALALIVTFGAGIGVGRLVQPVVGVAAAATSAPGATIGPTDFGLIKEAWDTLHKEYVLKDTLDDKTLIYGAIKGLTQAVGDTGHTDFMTPQERAERSNALSGSYVGIGVRIDTTEGAEPHIVSVFRDSPAAKAGLKADDVIVAVDGKDTTGKTLDTVASWVRGAAGTEVSITIRSGAAGTPRTLSIVRADVALDPVSWAMVPGSTIAFVRLDQFSSGAADELVSALKAVKEQGAQRIVLDLRGNPGGYVNEAVGVASQFLSSGTVFIERNAQGQEQSHPVSPGGIATTLPLVVMVDGQTASSSEIVSGALQDAGRAKIVGETTYGTGTVLGEFALTDGSALRVGTVEWLTPKGRRIWHEGIAPEVPVKLATGVTPIVPDDIRAMTPAQVAAIKDDQLTKALEVVGAAPAVAAS